MSSSIKDRKDTAGEQSHVAREIKRLKAASFSAASKRERLPQPLFWSLFHSALDDLRSSKKRSRKLNELLAGIKAE